MEIRYEELVGDTLGGVRAVLDWLGLPCGDSTLEAVSVEAAARFNVDPASPDLRADKWREEVSDADLAEFNGVAGPVLEELGYAVEGASGSNGAKGRRVRRGRGRGRALRGRDAAAKLKRNLAVFERFDDLLSAALHDEARALCASDAYFSVYVGGTNVAGRGEAPFQAMADAFSEHAADPATPIETGLHPGVGQFASVNTYALANGSRWTRTFVVDIRDGVVTGAALYRYELAHR
jgi:hypothetical protein